METAPSNEKLLLRRERVRPAEGPPDDLLTVRTPVLMEFEYWNLRGGADLSLSLHLYNERGVYVLASSSIHETRWHGRPFHRGLFHSSCYLPGDFLNDGNHEAHLLVIENRKHVVYRHYRVLVSAIADAAEAKDGW